MKFNKKEFMGIHSRVSNMCRDVESRKSLACDHTLGWRKEQSEAELWQEMGPWDGGQTVASVGILPVW